MATFATTAGCKQFRVFRACLEAINPTDDEVGAFTAFDATLIEDDEDDPSTSASNDDDASIIPFPSEAPARHDTEDKGYLPTTGHHDTSYDRYSDVAKIEDIEEDAVDGKLKPTGEMLLWHYRLGHVPFSPLQSMAKAGIFPRRLSDCRLPK